MKIRDYSLEIAALIVLPLIIMLARFEIKSHQKPAPQPQAAKVPAAVGVIQFVPEADGAPYDIPAACLRSVTHADTTCVIYEKQFACMLTEKDREIAQLKAELAKQRKLTGDAQGLVLRALRDMNSEDQLVTSCKNTMNTCLETLKESQGMIAPLPSEYQVNVWP